MLACIEWKVHWQRKWTHIASLEIWGTFDDVRLIVSNLKVFPASKSSAGLLLTVTSRQWHPAVAPSPITNAHFVPVCAVRPLSPLLSPSHWGDPCLCIMCVSLVCCECGHVRCWSPNLGEAHVSAFADVRQGCYLILGESCLKQAALSGLVYCCFMILLFFQPTVPLFADGKCFMPAGDC